MIAWSYGGGVQSVTIGVLIRQGMLPKPDLAVIADTSREVQSTWNYLRDVMQPYLEPAGVKIERTCKAHDVFAYSNEGLTLMPGFTDEGRLSGFCSGRWKRDPILRWLRSKGVEKCEQWICYSADEYNRVPEPRLQWCTNKYPLIDLNITRAMCGDIIRKAGLPMPRKSRWPSGKRWLTAEKSLRRLILKRKSTSATRSKKAYSFGEAVNR